ncbi:hypothetical protein D6827_03955 [Candidatus Parcubacteria bacterium]|nr:MAG: hypothetical protein D6827_03955 [Candidatus Parcubacteria bacterium]
MNEFQEGFPREEKVNIFPISIDEKDGNIESRVVWMTPLIMKRLELLNRETMTVKDERSAGVYAIGIYEFLKISGVENKLSRADLSVIIAAGFLTDIGKTGPRNALPEVSLLITEMHAIDSNVNPGMKIGDFLRDYIGGDYEKQKILLATAGVDAEKMIMRDFWDMHVFWTAGIIADCPAPAEVKIGALAHHILEGNRPKGINKDGSVNIFGTKRGLEQTEILVMLLDKYDAQRRRAGRDHKEAVKWIRRYVENNKNFDALKPAVQKIIKENIDIIDEALCTA